VGAIIFAGGGLTQSLSQSYESSASQRKYDLLAQFRNVSISYSMLSPSEFMRNPNRRDASWFAERKRREKVILN
jgi:hypothetical protein